MRLLFITACSLVTLTVWNLNQRAIAGSSPSPGQDVIVSQESGSVVVPTRSVESTLTPSNKSGYVVPTLPLEAVPTVDASKQGQHPAESPAPMRAIPGSLRATDPAPTSPGAAPQIAPETPETNDEADDGLGEIQEIPRSPSRRTPDFQALVRLSGISNVDSAGLATSATLLGTPQLGPDTRLIAFAGGGILLYNQFGGSDFSYFSYGVGVQQKLTDNMSVQLGIGQDRLYKTSNSQFVIDNGARFSVNRQDKLTDRLRLDSFYELRAGFADQTAFYDQSRVSNSLGVGLSYAVTPQLEAGLDLRLIADSFTRGVKAGTYGRLQTSLSTTYRFSEQAFVTGSVTYLYGSTLDPFDGVNSLSTVLFGITAGFNLY